MKMQQAKILIATDIMGNAYVMATDNSFVAWECDSISTLCEELGVDFIDSPLQICLWEGEVGVETYFNGDGWEPETAYKGSVRRVDINELKELISMQPPPTEEDE